jgi:hypothetical protein
MRNINLFINWFDSTIRPEEFDFCLKRNLSIFDRVINLNGYPTFTEFFNNASEYPNDVNVIANLDIYFDDSIELAMDIKEKEIYCLTRQEDIGNGRIITFAEKTGGHPGEWSQDAWVFTGINNVDLPFLLGSRGCDNHIAWYFNQLGYKVTNPSKSIKIMHLHNIDRSASMGRGERVGNENYMKVTPTEL